MAEDARGDSWRIATHSRDCYCCCCRCSHKEARTKSLNRFFFCSAFYLCRLLFRLDIDRHGINWGSWKEWNRKSVLGNGMQSIVCVWEVGRATWVEGREFRKNLKRDVCEQWTVTNWGYFGDSVVSSPCIQSSQLLRMHIKWVIL